MQEVAPNIYTTKIYNISYTVYALEGGTLRVTPPTDQETLQIIKQQYEDIVSGGFGGQFFER